VASIIAENRGNVIRLDHNQFVTANRAAAVELRVTIEAFGTAHKEQIVKALDDAGLHPQVGQAVI
jgi:threonine dehydratase